jgi:hypothetical protein
MAPRTEVNRIQASQGSRDNPAGRTLRLLDRYGARVVFASTSAASLCCSDRSP